MSGFRAPVKTGFAEPCPLPPAAIPSWAQLRYKTVMTENALHGAQSAAPVLARLGQFAVRLAATDAERRAACRLRYEVFYRERGVDAPSMDHTGHIEADAFDPFCDHLVVIDTGARTPGDVPAVVGTCRVMRTPAPGLGWATDAEFDLSGLFVRHPALRFCEVGRACVAPAYRAMRTIEALWCGLWAYACLHAIDAYFGTASFPGTGPAHHGLALSHLHNAAGAPPRWSVPSRGRNTLALERLPVVDRRAALRAMPPLVRGYLRINAVFGPEIFVDTGFGTTDVFVLARFAAAPLAYRRRLERVTGLRHRSLD